MRVSGAIFTGLASIAPIVAPLMLSAGIVGHAWGWPQGWAFVAGFAAMSVAAHVAMAFFAPASLAVRRQAPLAARAKKQPLWDAVGLVVFLTYVVALAAFIPLDVFRLKLLAQPSQAVAIAGGVLVLAGLTMSHVAIAQNRFAAPSVHDQRGSGQYVVDTGLYAHLRHPFYAGSLLIWTGMCLWLGSYAALAGVGGILIFTMMRIPLEERHLRAQLPDYTGYAARVRARLIPGLY